jgi:hypothetical protein
MNCSSYTSTYLRIRLACTFSLFVLFALVAAASRARAEPPKIDGLFDDWVDFHTGWKETGGIGNGHFGDDIDLKEFYYQNDGKWLYLFFRSNPSLAERYAKNKLSGMVAELYFDTDSSAATGARKIEGSRSPAIRGGAMPGIDVTCWVPIGVGMRGFPDGRSEKIYGVTYNIRVWEPRQHKFAIQRTRSESWEPRSLIAHGKDGFELAIPLSDLRQRPGDTFDFICVEWADNGSTDANRISIRLD